MGQKNKAQDKWIKGSIIFANGEWTRASRIPPEGLGFWTHSYVFPQQVSFFITFFRGLSETFPSPEFTGRNREHSLNAWGTKGKTHSQVAGDNPYCGKSRVESLTSWMQKLGLFVPRPYGLYAQEALKKGRKWCQPASRTSPFHVMYQTCKNSQMQDRL